MTERATGIKTTGADTYVATADASEQADGKTRVIQIISLAAGKVSSALGIATRSVSSNDSWDMSLITGDMVVGDNSFFACYLGHSQNNGSCLVTPLLCDDDGLVIGTLESRTSRVMLPVVNGTKYMASCLSWPILETGAWKIYAHITDLSDSNTIDIWCYTF
jgi:hypothetical protein